MKTIRPKSYFDAIKRIADAIDKSDGSIKSIYPMADMSMASVYRYINFSPELKTKLYYAQVKNLHTLINRNKDIIKKFDKEFYGNKKIIEFLNG